MRLTWSFRPQYIRLSNEGVLQGFKILLNCDLISVEISYQMNRKDSDGPTIRPGVAATILVRERNREAADRTLMTWIRTSLTLYDVGNSCIAHGKGYQFVK